MTDKRAAASSRRSLSEAALSNIRAISSREAFAPASSASICRVSTIISFISIKIKEAHRGRLSRMPRI